MSKEGRVRCDDDLAAAAAGKAAAAEAAGQQLMSGGRGMQSMSQEAEGSNRPNLLPLIPDKPAAAAHRKMSTT
jgi:hypothetical protein